MSQSRRAWAAESQQYLLHPAEQWQLCDLEEEKQQQVPELLNL